MLARVTPYLPALLVAVAVMGGTPSRVGTPPVEGHPALVPAWQALIGLRSADGQDVGSSYSLITEANGVRMTVGALPDGADAGFDPRGRRIIVSANLLGEDRTALAALLAHELTHALQTDLGEDLRRPCLELEVDAFHAQAHVWPAFWGGDPPTRTELDEALTQVSRIAVAEGTAGLRRSVAEDALYDEGCHVRCGLPRR